MTTKEFRIEVNEALRRLDRYEVALRLIAKGHWNAGREESISAEEYAQRVLDPAGAAFADVERERASL